MVIDEESEEQNEGLAMSHCLPVCFTATGVRTTMALVPLVLFRDEMMCVLILGKRRLHIETYHILIPK